jgi:hypothetical protein
VPSTGKVIEAALPGSILGNRLPFEILPIISVGIFCKPGKNLWLGRGAGHYVGRYSLN